PPPPPPTSTLFPYTTLFRSVVTHLRRDPVLHGCLRNEPRAQMLRRRRVRAQRRRQGGPQRRMGRRSEAHESIQHWLCARGECLRDRKSTRLNSSHVKISYAV